MNAKEILSRVDHTILKPEATWEDVRKLCDEAMEANTASVCINPCFVKRAADYMKGKIAVCTVVGFPLGASATEIKVAETKKAIEDGCDEIDMVINVGELKAKNYDYVREEIAAVKKAAGSKVVKVIIEACLLTDEEKEKMCELVFEGGADYIKTSTGFSSGGATYEDVALMKRCVNGRYKIKAAGGINSREALEKFIELGADRIGSSRAIKLLGDMQ